MWNTPNEKRLSKIPKPYETEHVALMEKNIWLHFFIGGCDWWVVEFDGEDLFWGFAILNGDLMNAEWGYFNLSELKSIKIGGWLEVDCELEEFWEIRTASKVEQIGKAMGWTKIDAAANSD